MYQNRGRLGSGFPDAGGLLVQDALNKGILVLTLPVNGLAVIENPAPERQGMEETR
jgi:hypothetical protein